MIHLITCDVYPGVFDPRSALPFLLTALHSRHWLLGLRVPASSCIPRCHCHFSYADTL